MENWNSGKISGLVFQDIPIRVKRLTQDEKFESPNSSNFPSLYKSLMAVSVSRSGVSWSGAWRYKILTFTGFQNDIDFISIWLANQSELFWIHAFVNFHICQTGFKLFKNWFSAKTFSSPWIHFCCHWNIFFLPCWNIAWKTDCNLFVILGYSDPKWVLF